MPDWLVPVLWHDVISANTEIAPAIFIMVVTCFICLFEYFLCDYPLGYIASLPALLAKLSLLLSLLCPTSRPLHLRPSAQIHRTVEPRCVRVPRPPVWAPKTVPPSGPRPSGPCS